MKPLVPHSVRLSRLKILPVLAAALGLCIAAHAVTVTNIAAGEYHSLLLKSDGSFWGMGYNSYGQLGDGTYNDVYAPELLASNGVVHMAGGGYCTLFIKSDGSLWGTGYNGEGELGLGTTLIETNLPVELVSSGVVEVAAGEEHSLFLKSDGSLWGMGYNSDGELGDGTTSNRYAPEEIVSSGVVAIAAGAYHSLFLKSDGSLWGMGYNEDGELGDGTYDDAYAPEELVSNGVAAVFSCAYTTLFLKSNGSLWGMGYNDVGQLGVGATVDETPPVEIVSSNVVAAAAGYNHSLFLESNGSLWGMGRNGDGQLGLGTSILQTNTPAEIVSNNITAIAAGFYHTLYLSDGSLWAMGDDADGELGDGTGKASSYVYVPEKIDSFTFSANPVSGFPPLTVQFTGPEVDFYGNPIIDWNWNFGDGSSSPVQNPSHTYLAIGNYSPSLVVTNNLGAAAIGTGPQISALYNSGIVTNGGFGTGNFSGWTQSGNTSYTSVVSSNEVTYPQYYILSGDYGCRIGPPTFGYLSQTLPTTPGQSYLISCWLNTENAYEVDGQSQFTVSWNSQTLLDATNPPETGWLNYQFVVTATSASTVLQFGFETYNYLGFDDVSVFPIAAVAAAAAPTNGPFPLTVHFTSPSTDNSGRNITSWAWNFGDGTTNSPLQNPTHTYFKVGTFSPTLAALNNTNGLVAWVGPPITVTTPTLQYTASPTNAAAPFTVQFTSSSVDSGGSAITNWDWNFGDGGTSTAQNPSHTYTVQGTFPLTLEATNSYGLPVDVSGPAAIQSSGLVDNYGFEILNPTNDSEPADWIIGTTNGNDAYADISQEVTHSSTNSLNFYNPAIVSQNLSTVPGVGYLVSFWIYRQNYDNSGGGYFSASWNGNTIFYQGTNNVTLYVWTNIQCYVVANGTNALLQFQSLASSSCDIYLDDVSVTPAEVEAAAATPSNGPINLAVQFNAPGTDTYGQRITGWNWNFGDGSPPSSAQNPSHTYTAVGSFYPVLFATNSQGATVPGASLAVTTSLPTVQVAASVTNGTAPLAVQFTTAPTDNSGLTLTSWNWIFADGTTGTGQNPLHTYYNDSGNPSVYPPFQPALIGTNSAGIKVIGIVPPVWVTYNEGLIVDGNFQNDFLGWSANYVAQWINGGYSGNTAAEFYAGGSIIQTIATTPGAGYALTFAAETPAEVNNIKVLWNGQPLLETTNWIAGADSWSNFEFFVTATNTNSTLEFLCSTNPVGSEFVTDVGLLPVEIEPLSVNPVAGPIPLTVQFNAPSTDTAGNTIAHWDWNFGDGSPPSSAQNPSHTYTSVGSFTPVLTATAASGAPVPAASGPVIVTTLPAVAVTATPTSGFTPLTVQFNAAGTDNSGQAITSWNWNFGDGSTSTAQNPLHIYTGAGTFTPTLTGTNAAGIEVVGTGPMISVAYTFNEGIVSNGGFETGDFTGWSFPNGNGGASVSTGSDYAYSGTYGAQLGPTVVRYLSQTLSTTPGASYVLSYWLYCNGETPNQFLAEWNGNTLINQTNIPATGWKLYQFVVTATSASTVLEFGYYNSPSYFGLDDVSVVPTVQFTANPTNGTAPIAVQFNGPAVDTTGATITNWAWEFGDGSFSTAQNPSHTYLAAGTFQPVLAVINNAGLEELAAGPAIIVTSPEVTFTASPTNGAAPLMVQFGSGSVDTSGKTISSWNWNFGDGSTSTTQNPSHTYVNAGTFSPTLVATNNLGAQVLGVGPATIVVSAPEVAFSANPTNGVQPLTVQFSSGSVDTSGKTITSWNWNFGDGSTSIAQNPSHIYVSDGTFSPTLVATNNLGAQVLGVGPATISVAFNSGLVTNGGFETGSFSGWNFPDGESGASIATSTNYVHSGAYGAELGPTSLYYLAQTLSTTPGAMYTLSFWLRNESGVNNEFLAFWNGGSLLSLSDLPAGAWSNYVFTVTASSSSTVLEFGYENGPSYFGLDDISVLPANVAGPVLAVGRMPGNQFEISWPVTANVELQIATNLVPPVGWQPITTGIVTNAGVNSIVITNSPGGGNQFYRLATP